ncbi:MAG: hypothetical protein IT288_07705 [Bdellovibrionales bacterium]|nr:hypothetical protein [Bdellovibrionales bacterium]
MRQHFKVLGGIFLCLFLIPTSRGDNFKYSELQIRDYDEMLKDVKARVLNAKKLSMEKQASGDDEEGDRLAVEALRDALKLVLSRPNEDNMVTKLMPMVRSELNNFNAFEDTLNSITDEAIRAINSDTLPVVYRATALFILENIMSEVRPELENKEDFKSLLARVRDAKIKVPDKIANERKLRSMYKTKSPSEIAEKLLKDEEVAAKKRAEKAAKEKTPDVTPIEDSKQIKDED